MPNPVTCGELAAYARLPLRVVAAEGTELILEDGRRVLDLYGGHCVNTLGAGDAELGRAVAEQWRRLSFASNVLDLDVRAEFLAAFGPSLPPAPADAGGADGEPDWRVFLANSGSEANENALKAAFSATGRGRVVGFEGAFHGRTASAAALSDGGGSAFPRAPFEVTRVPFGDLAGAEAVVGDDVAAVVLEPIQSMGGVVDPPPGFLAGLRELCTARGALLVFDEVQTGNGRLGSPWAGQHFGVVPDLITTAKGAAGGLPIGVTVVRAAVAARLGQGLFGSTFGGGPTVLAAATEVARRLARPGFLDAVRATSRALRAAALAGPVKACRGAGLLLGLELEDGLSAAAVRDALLAAGVLVGTSRDPRVLRLTPPLTLDAGAAERLASAWKSMEVPA